MVPDGHPAQDINNALFLMARLSPASSQSLNKESFRESAEPDEATAQYVLEDSFQSLVTDLASVGLLVNIDWSEWSSDTGHFLKFLQILSFLSPSTLYPLLQSHSTIKLCLEQLLDGSHGDEETLIQTYVSALGGLGDAPPLLPTNLAELCDSLYHCFDQTSAYSDTIKNLIAMADDEKLVSDSDVHDHEVYRDRIASLAVRLSEAQHALGNINATSHLQTMVVRDWLSPDNFTLYHYLFTQTPEQLPENLIPGFQKRWYEYAVSNPWCLDYFVVRGLIPVPEQVALLYCFQYALHDTLSAFQTAMSPLRERFPSPDTEQRLIALYGVSHP